MAADSEFTADHLEDLVRLGTLTRQAARFLEPAVVSGLNILVAGGTQAGKATLLNCLGAAIPAKERVVTCEEVFELAIPGLLKMSGAYRRRACWSERGTGDTLKSGPSTPAPLGDRRRRHQKWPRRRMPNAGMAVIASARKLCLELPPEFH